MVDHTKYQNREKHGEPKPLALHNMISPDFIKGVMKNLTCPICQEMVTNPVIYKSCLHRFCSNCIETYNRQGKKECPLCRVAIGNRRQLRPDKNIAALMSHLTEEFKKINRMDELDNIEIKRKLISDQKKLKEKKKRLDYKIFYYILLYLHLGLHHLHKRIRAIIFHRQTNSSIRFQEGVVNFGIFKY